MHQLVFLCLALLLAMSVLAMIGQRLNIPTPIFLVIGGLAISLIPGIPNVDINPELIFLIFLPPLLYEAAWFMSWKELWRWRRIVSVLAFGLVIITSVAVAYVSSAVIPGFTLALGFLLGGIISPPDAVAATSVLRNVDVPKSTISILQGESLVNDASSLIVFRFALAAVVSGSFVWQKAAVDFVSVTIFGVLVGLVVAGAFYVVHRWLPFSPRIGVLLTFLAPYTMYLVAEEVQVSGVMAVVSGGLFLSSQSHRILSSTERIQAMGMWNTVGFTLNGLVFILIGLELPIILKGLGNYSLLEAIEYGLLITAVVVVTRLAFGFISAAFTNFIGQFITVAVRNVGYRAPIILGWAGMRGVVSLASALSIPLVLQNGHPFPYRNLILFITFIVILVTLVFQGLTLPTVARWVDLQDPVPRMDEKEQEKRIRLKLNKAALQHLLQHHTPEIEQNELVRNMKIRLEEAVSQTKHRLQESDEEAVNEYNQIRAEIIEVKRNTLQQLSQVQEFEDEIIRAEESRMDLDEEKSNALRQE